ncbi:hypothetical protein [Terrarubrum flagellatum]|uniref:hypothetical protein n=1 Tax=Terrirubrum flagellatum TaxID=2895980 RepID=UPI003144F553
MTMIAAATVLTLTSATLTIAQSESGWREMTFHDLRDVSPSDPLQTIVWPDVIAEANDYAQRALKRDLNGRNAYITALSARFASSNGDAIVSTILNRACDSGANSKGADIAPSICPLRIVVISAGKLARIDALGCYTDHDDDTPEKNRTDAVYVKFDEAARRVDLRANVGGRERPECARSIPLPKQ